MLKKYLQFLIDSFEKLTSLGGSNSTWNDYFLTVGNELLVILIGLAYIIAIRRFCPAGDFWWSDLQKIELRGENYADTKENQIFKR